MATQQTTLSRDDKIKIILIVIVAFLIIWMVATSEPEKEYYCSSVEGQTSLTNIGTCTTDPPE